MFRCFKRRECLLIISQADALLMNEQLFLISRLHDAVGKLVLSADAVQHSQANGTVCGNPHVWWTRNKQDIFIFVVNALTVETVLQVC